MTNTKNDRLFINELCLRDFFKVIEEWTNSPELNKIFVYNSLIRLQNCKILSIDNYNITVVIFDNNNDICKRIIKMERDIEDYMKINLNTMIKINEDNCEFKINFLKEVDKGQLMNIFDANKKYNFVFNVEQILQDENKNYSLYNKIIEIEEIDDCVIYSGYESDDYIEKYDIIEPDNEEILEIKREMLNKIEKYELNLISLKRNIENNFKIDTLNKITTEFNIFFEKT